MKENRIQRRRPLGLIVLVTLVVFALLTVGVCLGYDKLHDLYVEQCVIRDMAEQVTIRSGKMVKPDVIAENLGLRVGANLALIDFAEKRTRLLKKVHTLKDISIARRLPDKVTVIAEERIPIVRMGVRGQRQTTGRVADDQGVVFICQRGTQLLPIIYEPTPPGTPSGERLCGLVHAALVLIKACQEPAFAELNLQDVDTSKTDYLLATLGNYSRVKIAWDGMTDPPNARSRDDLAARLDNLVKAVRTQIGSDIKIWNATMPNVIFADTQENH